MQTLVDVLWRDFLYPFPTEVVGTGDKANKKFENSGKPVNAVQVIKIK